MDIQFATAYSNIRLLPATRLVSSYQNIAICDCLSCMSTTTHLLVDIVVVRNISHSDPRPLLASPVSDRAQLRLACELCQRVKSSSSLRAPLQPQPVPVDHWESVSMGFVFGFPADSHKNTVMLVFVDRSSKMVHLVAVPESINASAYPCLYRHDLLPSWVAS